ncbi:TrmH family RNA methyltransferase [Croceivirga thetidis]|uniref:tRNA (guanosine(18)-2'-O)-methyltransferase n=1 Tax=Croceivirga thetidis TaxID=2721623 RepID=A0ABX1GRQ2_9FLAO|nr:RNA methyltransferase [Croceivirga thetidis]NKI32617.1 RNA methyltransferase [Croceivirga thetidis]
MVDIDLLEYLEGFLTTERKARFEKILSERTNFLTVAIEDVFQLHNTSAIVRSCDSFGIQSVHVVEERYQERLDKNIAMGAQKWVDVHRYQSTSTCVDELKSRGYQVIATSPHEQSVTLDSFEFSSKTALFFGTEWHGLSQEVLDKADGFLHIPMIGFSESLNVSVSAAIILQTLSKKLRNSNFDWTLSEDEILRKRLDWAKKSIKNVEGIIERYLAD